jgi:hypothetical protein
MEVSYCRGNDNHFARYHFGNTLLRRSRMKAEDNIDHWEERRISFWFHYLEALLFALPMSRHLLCHIFTVIFRGYRALSLFRFQFMAVFFPNAIRSLLTGSCHSCWHFFADRAWLAVEMMAPSPFVWNQFFRWMRLKFSIEMQELVRNLMKKKMKLDSFRGWSWKLQFPSQ